MCRNWGFPLEIKFSHCCNNFLRIPTDFNNDLNTWWFQYMHGFPPLVSYLQMSSWISIIMGYKFHLSYSDQVYFCLQVENILWCGGFLNFSFSENVFSFSAFDFGMTICLKSVKWMISIWLSFSNGHFFYYFTTCIRFFITIAWYLSPYKQKLLCCILFILWFVFRDYPHEMNDNNCDQIYNFYSFSIR